ncbi:MAG: SDR family NAD(P)-dependent oxidoreductase, partial [Gammaproteobacteria bacterium]|nr:SDR family NAD(P)-dependent oxidoreductase [Gammaproteobacteria bacterium]
MGNRVADKVAIITGASRGVGLEDAKLMVAEGATVIMADVNVEAGQKAAAEIGDGAQFVKLDVSSEADWKSLIALVEEQHGRLDILVNNAGILQVGEIDKETLEGWRRV